LGVNGSGFAGLVEMGMRRRLMKQSAVEGMNGQRHIGDAAAEVAASTAAAAHRRDHHHHDVETQCCRPHCVEVVHLGQRAVAVCHDCEMDSGFLPHREAERLADRHRETTRTECQSLKESRAV
jgi:hypothetical protein